MMNKTKSGKMAQAKMLLAVPALIIAFIVFANCDKKQAQASEQIVDVQKHNQLNIDLPTDITRYKKITTSDNWIGIHGDKLYINQKEADDKTLRTWLESLYAQHNKRASVVLEISKNTRMAQVKKVHLILRETNVLKMSYLVKVEKSSGDKFAFTLKLPPITAKEVDIEELKNNGICLLELNTGNLQDRAKLKTLITEHYEINGKKCLMRFVYKLDDSFQDYLSTVDVVFESVNRMRDDYSLKQFKMPFAKLAKAERNGVRHKFPIALTVDSVEQ